MDFTQVLQDMIGDLTGAPAARRREALFSRCDASIHMGAAGGGCSRQNNDQR